MASYTVFNINRLLWRQASKKAHAHNLSLKAIIERLLEQWIKHGEA